MSISEYRPWHSENLRIDPAEVKAANEELKRRGVANAGFDEEGRAVAHSKRGRNGVLKFIGVVDNEGSFNDYTGS